VINLATRGSLLNPPIYWQDFEDLCCDLWAEIWDDPYTQKYGRQGQSQHGVDIYGRPRGKSEFYGIQCKAKDNLADTSLTEKELVKEIKKAEKFIPKLSKFIIATTGPRDANIQESARKITQERLDKGLFPVEVYSWEDIKKHLKYYDEIIVAHGLAIEVNKTGEFKKQIEEMNADLKSDMTSLGEQVNAINTEPLKTSAAISALYKRDLKHAEELLNNNRPEEAFEYLKKFKEDMWATASDKDKYEILRFMASAKLKLLQNEETGKLLIEAFQYNPNDEKALVNKALGHLLREEFADAKKYSNEVLDKNPTNSKAYSILIQLSPDGEDLGDILLKIPKPERNSLEVAFAMSMVARKRKSISESIKWLKITNDLDENDSPDIKANLAESMLKEIFHNHQVMHIDLLNESEQETLRKIAEMLDEAWADISSEMKKSRISWIVNLSTTKKILGNLEEALTDIEIAMNIKPSTIYKKYKASILAENTHDKEAQEILIELYNEVPEAPLINALVSQKQNKYADAIEIINKFLESKPASNLIKRANEQLITLYILNNDPDSAKRIHKILYGTHTKDINGLINESQISKLCGNKDYNNPLIKAKQQIDGNTPEKSVIDLAEEFFYNDDYLNAAEIYEMFVTTELDSIFTRHLINCYYKSGELGKALEICKSLREKDHKPLKYVSEVEIAIYNEIDDLKNAKELIEEYLKFYPSNIEMKINQALINLPLNNLTDLDEFLNSDFDLDELSLEQFIRLMNLYGLRKINQHNFINMLYEMRRKFFQNFRAHAEYIKLLILSKIENELSPIKANLGMAVLIEYSSGEKKWFILEEKNSTRIEELVPDNPISKKLIGVYLGQKISIGEGPFSTEIVKIIDIKEKYIYAMQESREILKYSHNDVGFYSIELNSDENKKFEPLFDILREQNKRKLEIERIFDKKLITIGALSNVMKSNVIATWISVINNPNLSLKCYSDTTGESNNIYLLKRNKKLIIDLVSLLTINEIKIKDNIIKTFGKFGIAQSTIDEIILVLNEQIENRERDISYTGISSDDDVTIQTISPENVESNIKYLEDLLAWIDENCEIIPCKAALTINRNKRNKFSNMLGKSFMDTILIAKEEGNLLYSDDGPLRVIAKQNFDVEGIWTQAVLVECLTRDFLKTKEYNKAVVDLIRFDYNTTYFNVDILITAAEESKWMPLNPYTSVINVITRENKQPELPEIFIAFNPSDIILKSKEERIKRLAFVKILNRFISELSKQSITEEQRGYLTSYLISKIASRTDGYLILYLLTQKRFPYILNR